MTATREPLPVDYAIAKRANDLWGAAINGPHVAALAAMLARQAATPEQPEQERAVVEAMARIAERFIIEDERDERDNARNATATLIAAAIRATSPAPQELTKDTHDAA